MPTYEYVCDACDHEMEEFQSMTAKPLRKCPSCGKNKLRRLIGTGAGIIFKGSGFYETDYRSDSYKNAAKKDKEAASPKSDSKDSSSTSSDSKPAAKSENSKEKKPAKTSPKSSSDG